MATHTAERAAGGLNAATTDPHLLLDDRVWLLRAMLLMRGIEERAMTLYRQGKVPGSFYDGYGHEAMNWAGVQKLPVVFVLENNQYAYSTPLDKQFAVDPVERAAAYGFVGVTVDGNDVEAVFDAAREARTRALAGDGPTLIEALTMRMHGHAAHDDMQHVPKEQVEEWRKRDPVDRQEARLRSLGFNVETLRAEVQAEIDAATEEALRAPMPDPASAV